jgi:hypothetical protein
MDERPLTDLEVRMLDDLDWAEKSSEVQRHEGKLVVVQDKRVLAVGTDQDALLEEAAKAAGCPQDELVVVVVPRLLDLQDIPH